MSSVGANVRVNETEAQAKTDAETDTNVDIMTRSEQIARYMGRDLLYLVEKAGIDLAQWLEVPDDYVQDSQYLVQMLCADVELMLSNGLIKGADILLTDTDLGDDGRHKVRYQARYVITGHTQGDPVKKTPSEFWGGLIEPLAQTHTGAGGAFQFVFGIEWQPEIPIERLADVCRPKYLFDWVVDRNSYDASQLVSYRFGGMSASGTKVTRIEFVAPQHLR